MGFDFTHLPGGGGATGKVVTGLDTAVNAALCIGMLDIFACFKAVVDVFLEIFDVFFGNIFSGRPKVGPHSATDAIALFFIPSANPVVAQWGMGVRIIEAKGIPISTSNPTNQKLYINLATAVHSDLIRQFGAADGAKLFTDYAHLTEFHNPYSNGNALRGRQVLDEKYDDAVKRGRIDPHTGFPPQGSPPPPPPPPVPGPCTDPCELAMQQIITGTIAPLLDSAAAAMWWLRASLGPSVDPEHLSAIDRIATALAELETCVCADLNALLNYHLPTIEKIMEREAAAAEKLEQDEQIPAEVINAAIDAGIIDPDVAAALADAQAQGATKSAVISKSAIHVGGTISGGKVHPFSASSPIVHGIAAIDKWLKGLHAKTVPALKDLQKEVDKGVAETFNAFFNVTDPTFGNIAKTLLGVIDKRVDKLGHIEPGAQGPAEQELLGDALALGMSAHITAVLAEILYPTKQLGLPQLAALMAELAGFKEITASAHGPILRHAIRIPTEYDAAAKFTSSKPDARTAGELLARRQIDQAQADQLYAWQGYSKTIAHQMESIAYRPVSPFVLSRLADGPDWDPAAMREMLRFSGYRDKDIDLLIKAFEAQALRSLRQQYLTAAMASYEAGFSQDADLQKVLDDLKFNTAAQDLIKKIAGLKKSDRVFKEHLAAEEFAVNGGAITIGQYQANLRGLGLAPEVISGLVDHAQAHDAATTASAQRREVETLIRHERQLYIQDWLLAFQQGYVNEIELTAGLLAIGLPLAVVAEYVALGELRKKPPKKPPAKKPPGA